MKAIVVGIALAALAFGTIGPDAVHFERYTKFG